jgi:hypothetical protein
MTQKFIDTPQNRQLPQLKSKLRRWACCSLVSQPLSDRMQCNLIIYSAFALVANDDDAARKQQQQH